MLAVIQREGIIQKLEGIPSSNQIAKGTFFCVHSQSFNVLAIRIKDRHEWLVRALDGKVVRGVFSPVKFRGLS